MPDSVNKDDDGNEGLVFAVDLGGTHLRSSTVSKDGKIHHRRKQQTPRAAKAEEIVHAITRAAREFEELGKVDGRCGSGIEMQRTGCCHWRSLARRGATT